MKYLLYLLFVTALFPVSAQDKGLLPYYEIPAYPETYTAGSVASRMIDGLGFRYYWATEGLRSQDLSYKPGADTRTTEETLTHIYELSILIVNSITKTANTGPPTVKLAFSEMRKQTLENLKNTSDRLRNASDTEMKDFKLIFKRDSNTQEFPFWHELNGPIADCLWHVGQVVSFRRASGNPFTDKVNVFTGTVRQ
jgi:hypothetical protein